MWNDPRLADCRRLFLHGFEMLIPIGVHEFEKKAPQRFQVDVDVYLPLALSTPHNDQLSEVFDYDQVYRILHEYDLSQHTQLQETFCDIVAQKILAYPMVRAVRVRTQKPDVYPQCKAVGVEVFHIKEER